MTTDTEILNWLDAFDCGTIILHPDGSDSDWKYELHYGQILGAYGSAISIRDVVKEFRKQKSDVQTGTEGL